MPTEEDSTFAKVALHNKLLTMEQIETCFQAIGQGKYLRLAEVVLKEGLLSEKQVSAVASAAQFTLVRERDRLFSQALLAGKLAGREDIEKAFQTQQQAFEAKKRCISIVDILVQKGIVDREAAREVVRQAGRQPSAAPGVGAARHSESRRRAEKIGQCRVIINTVSLQTGRRITRLDVAGPIDTDTFSGLQKIIGEVTEEAGDEGKYLILNLQGVDYMSSAGVGILISAKKATEDKGGAMALANVASEVREVLVLVGLDSVLEFHTLPQALDAIAGAR